MRKYTIDPEKLEAFKEHKKTYKKTPTLANWLKDWLKHCIKPNCKPSTYTNYSSYIHKHIIPILGGYLLTELEPVMIQYFIKDQLDNGRINGKGGLSAKTVEEYRNMLNLALNKAVEDGYISSNPCQFVQVSRERTEEVRTLSIEEQELIQENVISKWKTASDVAILVAMHSGMRIGEVAGLQIRDIDLKRRLIYVKRSLNRFKDDDGKYSLRYGTPKSGCGRCVPMNDDLHAVLSVYMESMPSIYKKTEAPLFTNKSEKAMEPRLISYHFHKLMKKLDIEDVHFHCLRHTFATRALEADMNIKVCSTILGHASTQITTDIYTHVTPPQMAREMKKMNIHRLKENYA